jgi:hypothetical protein
VAAITALLSRKDTEAELSKVQGSERVLGNIEATMASLGETQISAQKQMQ